MNKNHDVIRKLMADYINLTELRCQMGDLGIQLPYIGGIRLFERVLDIIGFPKEERWYQVPDEEIGEYKSKARSKLEDEAACLELDGIDAFLVKLYAEYDELQLEYPELFVQNDNE